MLRKIFRIFIILIALANCVYAQKEGDVYRDKNHKNHKGVVFAGGTIVERYLHLGVSDHFIGVEVWRNGENIFPKFYPWKRQYSDSYEEVGHGLFGGYEILSDSKILIFSGYPPLNRPFIGYIFEIKPGQTHFTLIGKNLTDTIITRDNYSLDKIKKELKGETNFTRAYKRAKAFWQTGTSGTKEGLTKASDMCFDNNAKACVSERLYQLNASKVESFNGSWDEEVHNYYFLVINDKWSATIFVVKVGNEFAIKYCTSESNEQFGPK